MSVTVTLIPGDGIGPSIVEAVKQVVATSGAPIRWDEKGAGLKAAETTGNPMPRETLDSIANNKVALKGPLITPVGEGYRSVNVALRKEFDLYANIRPAQSLPGIVTRFGNVDLVVIRENTEELYSGVEHFISRDRDAAESISIITRKASERIVEYAFKYALEQGRKKITLVHKANILKCTSGLFLEVGKKISEKYPKIIFEDKIVDNMCMQLVLNPERFDVIVTTNLFGDILSDLTAGLIGGLGVTPAANIGHGVAIFEAVHGSAPDLVGKNIANPTAIILAACMMLDYLDMKKQALSIRKALFAVLQKGEALTPDLGGAATTDAFTSAIIKNLKSS